MYFRVFLAFRPNAPLVRFFSCEFYGKIGNEMSRTGGEEGWRRHENGEDDEQHTTPVNFITTATCSRAAPPPALSITRPTSL